MDWRVAFGVALVAAVPAQAERFLVRDQVAYRAAARALGPGDAIVLADGEWRDFEILFEAEGTAAEPVTLTAENPGRVILTGQSSLRLAGAHLIVSNLVFRDGHAPGEEVIAFRRDSRRVASHSRLTGIVIDHFNQPDRRREDRWVSLYGTDNRVDHSHFAGKGNAGVTLAVIRPTGQLQANRHRIDHNYFGPRPVLGSNGGETIRIGTSEESLSNSDSIVENNYFERCDGEVEIVSVKSGGNVIRGNTFFESQGAVVLRHGNGNLVERNVFLGNGRPNTGGIRVINRDQTVRANYLEGLAGTGFASALAVMNGVPNSAINRYHQVANARIERNSFVAGQRLTFAAGADAERSAAPVGSRFEGNLIAGEGRGDPVRIDGDIAGIVLAGNVQSEVPTPRLDRGIAHRTIALVRAANGLLYPADPTLTEVGAPRDLRPVSREETGVSWYPKPAREAAESPAAAVEVRSGTALAAAIAQGGGAFRLGAGEHRVAAPIVIDRAVRIDGAGQARTRLRFSGDSLFRIEEGGRLSLSGLAISGTGAAVIRTSVRPMIANYGVALSGVAVTGIRGDVIATGPAALADRIAVRDSRFADVTGAVLAAHSETATEGYYNAEEIEIAGSQFLRVGRIADVFRGGRDESTFGPRFVLTGSTIRQSGGPQAPSLLLSGVQRTRIADNRFVASGPIAVTHSVGAPDTEIADNRFAGTPPPQVTELYWQGPARAVLRNNRP